MLVPFVRTLCQSTRGGQTRTCLHSIKALPQYAVSTEVKARLQFPLFTAVRTIFKSPGPGTPALTSDEENAVQPAPEYSPRKFVTPSPYKVPGPPAYGYDEQIYEGGPLPRLETPLRHLPKYKPRDEWSRKQALFGQNDYIDLLGDSKIRPMDLIQGPSWLRGFRGNEMQRLVRRMHAQGHIMRQLYPTQYHQTWKRIKFLYKNYNQKRGKRH